jgi:transcription initiation factor IIE alpha subunit
MNWNALKDGQCPKCGGDLHQPTDSRFVSCIKRGCGFTIGESKLKEIIRPKPRGTPQGDGWERFDS